MANEIRENLVYLCENISNLPEILLHLIQQNVISTDESNQIKGLHLTPLEQNALLLEIIQKKDWKRVRSLFLEILQKTNNRHCVNEIEGKSFQHEFKNSVRHPKISKWWPDKKPLIRSLQKRKFGSRLLVEELHARILKDERRMVVLCESTDAAKLTGMGGVGKTITAKWYAHAYEEEYDHVLWIDCGEDSLLKSFKNLTSDLDVKNRNDLHDVEEFARKCYVALSEFKCLWIYDNAENYQGKDGIIEVLPKCRDNFYCLITSRSRDWGFESGYGQTSLFELEIFGDDESMEFLKANLKKGINYTEHQLNELIRLLGNLPLALQLAVSTLNRGKINLHNYLEKTSAKDVENIVDVQFDAYEKTIYKSVKMSLDLIVKENRGEEALKILLIFGYIRPDQIPSKFLLAILNIKLEVLQGAVDLLEKYSLINKTGKILEIPHETSFFNRILGSGKTKVEMDLLSIHRLLQQVIRHNGREKEGDTIKEILNCKEFIEYKLIPFKYADEDIRKQFPKIRAQLLDQNQLKKLIKEKRVEECVEFAKFIHQELNTTTTKFNYAICLQQNGQLEECVKTLEELCKLEMKEDVEYGEEFSDSVSTEMGLLELGEQVSKALIEGHLLVAYTKLDDKQKRNEFLEKRNRFRMIYSQEILGCLIQLVHSDLKNSNYSLTAKDSFITLNLGEEKKVISIIRCSLSLNSFHRLCPEELNLTGVPFFRDDQELEKVEVNDFIDLPSIKRLELNCDPDRYNMRLDLAGDVCLERLHLWSKVRVLNWDKSNGNIDEIDFSHGVPFVEKTNIKIRELNVGHSSLDVTCLPQSIQKLTLWSTQAVFVSGSSNLPNLKHLTLAFASDICCLSYFRSAPLTHIHLNEIKKEINVDLLPPTVRHLKITKQHYKTSCVGGVRKLEQLILDHFSIKQIKEYLKHLETDNLAIYSVALEPKELLQLMNENLSTIAVGIIKWRKGDFKTYSGHFGIQADYYLLEGNKSGAMKQVRLPKILNKAEFDALIKLF